MSKIEIKKPKEGNDKLDKLKQKMLTSDCVKFSLNIPRHIHTKFKMKAAEDGKEMKDVLLPIILKYIGNDS